MANYKFGQFRRSQASEYLKPLQCSVGEIITETSFSQAITFKDKVLNMTGENVMQSVDETRTKSRSYYLKYRIYKQPESEQIISIKLVNATKEMDNEQSITTITIPKGDAAEFFAFDLVISPNSTYNQIAFILNRDSNDFMTENEDGTYGRIINIEVEYYEEIINVIDVYLNPVTGNAGILKQIGVQGPPGTLMCIEGEQIRIGRSGIYEINNGVVISFLGFVLHEDDENQFFLDYQY